MYLSALSVPGQRLKQTEASGSPEAEPLSIAEDGGMLCLPVALRSHSVNRDDRQTDRQTTLTTAVTRTA